VLDRLGAEAEQVNAEILARGRNCLPDLVRGDEVVFDGLVDQELADGLVACSVAMLR